MCDVKFCKRERVVGYYGHGVCGKCWDKHCEGKIDLKKEFKIVDVEVKEKVEKEYIPIQNEVIENGKNLQQERID